MYSDFTNDYEDINENQPIENANKLMAFRFFMQLIPIAMVILCFYIFFLKIEIWQPFLK